MNTSELGPLTSCFWVCQFFKLSHFQSVSIISLLNQWQEKSYCICQYKVSGLATSYIKCVPSHKAVKITELECCLWFAVAWLSYPRWGDRLSATSDILLDAVFFLFRKAQLVGGTPKCTKFVSFKLVCLFKQGVDEQRLMISTQPARCWRQLFGQQDILC